MNHTLLEQDAEDQLKENGGLAFAEINPAKDNFVDTIRLLLLLLPLPLQPLRFMEELEDAHAKTNVANDAARKSLEFE